MTKVVVTTAIVANSSLQKKIAAALEARLGKVTIVFAADPKVLGGISLRVNSQLYDATLAARLETIRKSLVTVQK